MKTISSCQQGNVKKGENRKPQGYIAKYLWQEILLSKWYTHHKRKKPRDTTAILTSCDWSWTSKRRYPKEAFSKESLCIRSNKWITLAMKDISHL